MSILFGILLYVVCVAFLCTLTGINRLDESEPSERRIREDALADAAARSGRVPARPGTWLTRGTDSAPRARKPLHATHWNPAPPADAEDG